MAMGWSLSGGWEDEMKVNSSTKTFKADDTLGADVLVYLHMFVIAVPLFLGLFSALSFFYVMFRYKLPAAVEPVAAGKGKKRPKENKGKEPDSSESSWSSWSSMEKANSDDGGNAKSAVAGDGGLACCLMMALIPLFLTRC